MPDHSDALTRLVQRHVGSGRGMTIRAFAAAAVDPDSGEGISKSTVGSLVNGHQIKITPEVLRAIAVGLGRPLAEVQAAAMAQYVGIVVDDPFDADNDDPDVVVRVAHPEGMTALGMPKVRAWLDRARQQDA